MKEITVQEYIDAIRKNGLPQQFGVVAQMQDGKVIAACAHGQACINLGITSENTLDEVMGSLIARTIRLNDIHRLDFDTIAHYLEMEFENYLGHRTWFWERVWSA